MSPQNSSPPPLSAKSGAARADQELNPSETSATTIQQKNQRQRSAATAAVLTAGDKENPPDTYLIGMTTTLKTSKEEEQGRQQQHPQVRSTRTTNNAQRLADSKKRRKQSENKTVGLDQGQVPLQAPSAVSNVKKRGLRFLSPNHGSNCATNRHVTNVASASGDCEASPRTPGAVAVAGDGAGATSFPRSQRDGSVPVVESNNTNSPVVDLENPEPLQATLVSDDRTGPSSRPPDRPVVEAKLVEAKLVEAEELHYGFSRRQLWYLGGGCLCLLIVASIIAIVLVVTIGRMMDDGAQQLEPVPVIASIVTTSPSARLSPAPISTQDPKMIPLTTAPPKPFPSTTPPTPAPFTTPPTPAPTTAAPTETMLERVKHLMIGTWEGTVDSPWGSWRVHVEFTNTGVVTSYCLEYLSSTLGEATLESCNSFSYGTDNYDSTQVERQYELNDLRANGAAQGWIDVAWEGYSSIDYLTRGSLDSVIFLDNDHLVFEFIPTWQDGGLGRIFSFSLERV